MTVLSPSPKKETANCITWLPTRRARPCEVFSERGELLWQAQYDLWGSLRHQHIKQQPHWRGQKPTAKCNLRFQGQQYDAESGLHYNRHRYYDPETAQYISPDPIGLAGGLNPQAYVHNPTGWVDPLGLCECKIGRKGAFNQAKRDSGIPRSQQPDSVNHVPLTDMNGKSILGSDGKPIMTREYTYTRADGSKVVIQDHSAGHKFGQGGIGDQGSHFNVRPIENTRTGSVPGTLGHYPFD